MRRNQLAPSGTVQVAPSDPPVFVSNQELLDTLLRFKRLQHVTCPICGRVTPLHFLRVEAPRIIERAMARLFQHRFDPFTYHRCQSNRGGL